MAAGSRGEPAGGLLARLTRKYYLVLADSLFSDEKGEHKRGLIEGLLSSREVGWALEASLTLAERLQLARIEALRNAGFKVLAVYFTLSGPGLSGAGSGVFKSVFEVGMSVDRVLGLPYYPESTLKGASRAACEALLSGGSRGLADAVCGGLYGSRDGVGPVIHGPALPVGCRADRGPCTVYWGDVVNPHYYRGSVVVEKEYEAMPAPVVHLSIAPGTVFLGYLALRRGDERPVKAVKELAAAEGVPEALKRYTGDPLLAAAAFTLSAVLTGFAARSSKGYNIADPSFTGFAGIGDLEAVLASVEKSIVRLSLAAPIPRPEGEGSGRPPRQDQGRRRGRMRR